MPPAADPHEAGLIGHRAGERAATVAEQLAVGEVAARRRAVVGQEHRGAAMRSDVNRPGDQLLAGAALARDEHGQVVALQPLNLLDDARHRGARRQEAGQQRLERSVDGGPTAAAVERSRAAHSAKPWRATVAIIRRRRMTGWPIGRGEASEREARPLARRVRAARRRCVAAAVAPARAAADRASARAVSSSHPAVATTLHVAAGELDEHSRAVAVGGFEQRRRGLASEQIGQRRGVHDPPHDRIVGVGRRDDVLAGARAWPSSVARGACVGEIALGAELLEDGVRLVEMALGDRARAGLGDEAAEREMAERGLVALAEQIQQRRALREVVVRVGGAPAFARAARRAAAGTRPRWPARLRGSSASAARASRCLGFGEPARRGERFGGDERGLQRIERRRAGRENLVGSRDGLVERAAPEREPRAEHADRPFVPAARLPAVRAVRLAGAAEKLARDVVLAANQVNLRERVEDGAGGLVKLNRAADLERAVQRLLGAGQIAEPHADLSERGERHREAVAGSVRLVKRRRCARPARAPARTGARAS